jgi:hypothetical protein
MKNYIVWVGGTVVNDYLLTKKQAENLMQDYINSGYDDVCIEALKTEFVIY